MRNRRGVFRFFLVLLLTAAMCLATGCGDKKGWYIDEVKLVNDLIDQIKFDCPLYQVSEEKTGDFLSIDGAQKQILYMGSGAYSDSFGIFTVESEETAESALENVNSYLSDLQNSFQDYIPEEAEKIENAVVIQKGKYVVFCVTGDYEKAAELIESSFVETESSDEDKASDNDKNDDEQQSEESGSNAPADDYPPIETNASLKDYGNVVSVGDAAYELYSYTDSTAEKYASYVNKTAKALSGTSDVYDVIIPLSSGITLPDKFYGKISSSDQKQATENIIEKLNDDVKAVNMYDNLMKHRNEYIYFRTDHHWTALGAYYGYEKFCEAKGVIPISLDRHEKVDFEGFLGSFYNDTGKAKVLKENPDTITAYKPVSPDVSMVYTTTDGSSNSWEVIYDVTDYPSSIKYSTFIAGDNPMTVIKNKNIADGSKCVVLKESFGNAFVPFLVDHYSEMYVIDYRYWEGNVVDFAKEKGADDVIFLNNLSMIRSDYLTGKLGQVIG